jgi:excinuclease ABC subunit A
MIKIRGAREHNLKNIDVDIPHNALVVITGMSGSGKSSLALDTLFAEGQRRFVESLSAYARQFLGLMQKPRVDQITGLSPAIAIEQRNTSTGLRSTVGTSTEIYDYLRLLYAHIGVPHCPECGEEIRAQTAEEIINSLLSLPEKTRVEILAPVVRGKKGEHKDVLKRAKRSGFVRVRVDGTTWLIDEVPPLERYYRHSIEIVVDRLVIKDSVRTRLADSVETALGHGNGRIIVSRPSPGTESQKGWQPLQPGDIMFSQAYACSRCETNYEFDALAPRLFSFNSPYGACSTCHGLGIDFSDFTRNCPDCDGTRLKPYSRSVSVRDMTIVTLTGMPIERIKDFIGHLELTEEETKIVGEVCREISLRLQFLIDVGLGYITLSRRSGSLSGGEAQRIRLASQIGTGLTGVLYVLDEPTIGLHARDNEKLLQTLEHLRNLNNTVVVVEHDAAAIRRSDYIIDLGPGAGTHGGTVVFQGPLKDLLKHPKSKTAAYLNGTLYIDVPERRTVTRQTKYLQLNGAVHNNLKNIDVKFPLGLFTCVTGVSGSGKSSLITDTLLPALRQHLYNSDDHAGSYKNLKGLDKVDKVIVVNQSPIGRTPRSNPATYTGVFTHIRDLFSGLPEAKVRGYRPGRFSFNVSGGRCEACTGTGVKKIEMHFLPDVYVTCESCRGKRYNKETLEVLYRGKSIADILDMTIREAHDFFSRVPSIRKILQTLCDVGLEYIKLGQHATTLSGGEAQRVKLSNELAKRETGQTVYILDEPTTGLHFADIEKLLNVLQRLVKTGNTVIVIEHNLDVIKCADYIIDLGPEGGDKGGQLVIAGTPETVAEMHGSYTGQFLAQVLQDHRERTRRAA